jgi:hypothetical protein
MGHYDGQQKGVLSVSTPPTAYRQIDIVLPVIGQEIQVVEFCTRLSVTLRTFFFRSFNGRRNDQTIRVRLILPGSPKLPSAKDIAELAGLPEASSVVLVDIPRGGSKALFNRARVINTLFAASCRSADCLVTTMDVDMNIVPSFFNNAMTFVQAKSSVYFPVVWSTYNPATVALVEKFLNQTIHLASIHNGSWRPYGYGMFCMSGADAHTFSLDESFVGWGGEDNEFFMRLQKDRHIVRMQDKGLTHLWHAKNCDSVDKSRYIACVGSSSTTEGSPLGVYLSRQQLSSGGSSGNSNQVLPNPAAPSKTAASSSSNQASPQYQAASDKSSHQRLLRSGGSS